MENRIVIRGHGVECDQYMEMFVDFGRKYTISDIKPHTDAEVLPCNVCWKDVPFIIIGSEKNREQIENELISGGCQTKDGLCRKAIWSCNGIIISGRNF